MESMGECMDSIVEYMESIAEYMEQKHSTWNPPGMWGQGKVLHFSYQRCRGLHPLSSRASDCLWRHVRRWG